MTASLSVPQTWDDITPAWMTEALANRHPGARVESVIVAGRDDGTNRRARLALTYSSGTGPATVFAKAADPAHKEMIRMTSGMFHEPRLFTCGVELPVEHPVVYTALIDEDDYDFVMIMEDLTARGADPRDATRPMSVEQVASGIRGLARMHGRFWGDRLRQYPELNWLEPYLPWDGMQYAPLHEAKSRLGDEAPPAVLEMSIDDLIEATWKPYIRTLTAGPQTLLHGDPHIGNTYLLPGGEVGFLDWQVARHGNWSLDVGYFLQGALTIEDRRSSERELLEQYRASLGLPGPEMPSSDEVWLRYRASVAHGLAIWLCTASAGDLWQRPDIAVALAQRYSAAYADLDTAGALAEITGAQ
ncbi:aminoglycoside phosphotransferase [Mycobacterium kiyosense]|uniref:Aminoglycoside phosphotransferase n=2 Tax=Mycobacteriaceae TaxID=1762 RepID=A0A9P3V1P4_9MYCO|nr:aminoglycoside phosphotransferase [Mycobacterium sp. 20KCMC460]GLB82873.1 aminoglycoside phosphotransferase [Mycobacterium kiyosense]GLB92124.1 aminoglycoside phosphotransferase [Mycobacterium kiyosense]GLB98367.1 aminoglycoside phosphotransferase [Mycobacterium kiyosense]GLC04428.1 aminoglycoside phosphotransferase [Mycobacterium kiyosense]